MSSLLRSIQDCVQGVPVGQMAQGTPPSAHAAAFQGGFNRLHQLLHGFYSQQNEFKRQAQGAGASRGGCRARASATSRKTRKIRQTFRSCLSSLTRSCIQDCVQEVPVKQVAQGTPPSAHAAAFPGGFSRLHQLLHGFFTNSQVRSSQNHLPSNCPSLKT